MTIAQSVRMSPLFAFTAAALAALATLWPGEGHGVVPPDLRSTPIPSASMGAPDPPADLQVLAARGLTVTLAWQAAETGTAPTSYVIEGGFAPGEVLGSIPLAGAATAVTFDAPAGRFLVRVHAVAGGMRSAASNEIPLVVAAPLPAPAVAPSAPTHLLGLVDGNRLSLSWTSTFTGGSTERLWLRVTGTQTGEVAVSAGETFSVDGVPPGTYTVALVAENSAGQSAPSPPLTLHVPGACSGPPLPPTTFRSWQTGSTISIAWNPPTTGPAVSHYTVRVSGDLSLQFDTVDRLVSAPLPAGQYAVHVVATNACGVSASVPAAPDWTAVTFLNASHVVYWKAVPGVRHYRIFTSTSAQDLEPLGPGMPFIEATGSPVVVPAVDPMTPIFYRVFAADGPLVGGGGPVAVTTTFSVRDSVPWSGDVTPALWDIDGDGCLDLIGGWGNCDGTFRGYSLDTVGLFGLRANGRGNRDSRLADFTGDGITDIISNIYDRADTTPFATMLHVGDGQGGFTEDAGIAAMQIRGFGETIVAADFDNDGDIDVFLPHYSHVGDGGRNWLLINDGAGHFTDVAEAAGVAFNQHVPPEGAQAVDFNQDGWLDLHVASHLFMNNGDLTFTDVAPALGLPVLFDEGMRLLDIDLDGDLDLVHHDSAVTQLFTNGGETFDTGQIVNGADGATFGYGLNVCDVNGDAFEDVIVGGNDRSSSSGLPVLLLNVGGRLLRSDLADGEPSYHDLMACADLDGSGRPDLLSRWTDNTSLVQRFRSFISQGAPLGAIRLRVVGGDGARNQQGRAITLRPLQGPDMTILRTVESGSGYMAQNGYDLLIATPWPGDYEVEVRFASGWVRTTARPGDALTIRADGTVTAGLQ